MGEADFETAWTEGAALSTEEAIAYAQRGRGDRKRPSSGWASLTPTELNVAKLVGGGLANKDIAAKMFISPRTVQTHLTHMYLKLGRRPPARNSQPKQRAMAVLPRHPPARSRARRALTSERRQTLTDPALGDERDRLPRLQADEDLLRATQLQKFTPRRSGADSPAVSRMGAEMQFGNED